MFQAISSYAPKDRMFRDKRVVQGTNVENLKLKINTQLILLNSDGFSYKRKTGFYRTKEGRKAAKFL